MIHDLTLTNDVIKISELDVVFFKIYIELEISSNFGLCLKAQDSKSDEVLLNAWDC